MHANQQSSARAQPLPLLREGVCLVCGTAVPEVPASGQESLADLGWHSWVSRVAVSPSRIRASLLRLCPECVADPMFAATNILENYGPDELEEWIVSMELTLG